jgi:acetylornithine/LysW-gamma-L-lysine aminotransferase
MSNASWHDRLMRDGAAIMAYEARHTSGAYPQRPIAIVRGRGVQVFDAHGKAYLDMTSGQGVAILGHGHPAVVAALERQARRLITCPEIFFNDQRAALYRELVACLPPGMERIFLCNSGAEAVEGALKLARLLTGRRRVLAMRRGFHGRTLGALSATWEPRYRGAFEPLLDGFHHLPFNDLQAAQAAIDGETAAVLMEVVQGEGGVHAAQESYLRGVRALCRERGALLILDEIQTGMGRTGRWWACQHYGVVPDVICLGKGIAGGLPMGVLAWRGELGGFSRGAHGSTFGGNPLACAAARGTLGALKEGQLPERAASLGAWFMERLRGIDHPMVREVRGLGLMIGLQLRRRVTPVLQALMGHGVLALPAGRTTLRLLPPLVVEKGDLEVAATAIEAALEEVYHA